MSVERSTEELRALLLDRAQSGRNPFTGVPREEAVRIVQKMASFDADDWVDVFTARAIAYDELAQDAERTGMPDLARTNYLYAYGYYRIARYPDLSTPSKRVAYERGLGAFASAVRYLEPSVEAIRIPLVMDGQSSSDTIPGYLRRSNSTRNAPVLVNWGGIDTYKEDHLLRSAFYVDSGFSVVTIDMPGVGQSPVLFTRASEQLWDGVFDWIERHSDFDASRVAVVGESTGGYWATKLAHTHRSRVKAAVNFGGPAHHAFQRDWILQAERGEYPFELGQTLARAAGLGGLDDWIEHAPSLSLAEHDLLDSASSPLLLVNGTRDTVFPIEDMYLLLEHGSPKCARFFPGGHMAFGFDTSGIIRDWLLSRV